MKQQTSLYWLVPLIAVIAVIIAAAGLFSGGGEGPYPFTTVYGDTVEIDGHGVYSHDTSFVAALFRGTDAITLFVAVPLLLVGLFLYRRSSMRGSIFMTAMLLYFLYIGVTYTFSVIFNAMFLFYVLLFSAGLFATIVAFASFDPESLADRLTAGAPRRGMAIFLIIAGLGTLMLWLSELIGPIMSGTAPANLGPYTTMFTHGFDSAVITPATVLTGIYLLRRKALGYVLAGPLLILCALIGVTVIAQTISQTLAGFVFPIGVYIGMIGSWIVMGAFAVGLTIQYFRNISETSSVPPLRTAGRVVSSESETHIETQ